jgi:hypothetical protein
MTEDCIMKIEIDEGSEIYQNLEVLSKIKKIRIEELIPLLLHYETDILLSEFRSMF